MANQSWNRTIALAIASAFVTTSAFAGDINPPAGPVGDTFPTLGFKTLFQVEPRIPLAASDFPVTITQSGSYYLTEHVPFLGAPGEHGIIIDADDVSIDLMGFTLVGANEVVVGGIGIWVQDPNRENISIRNGFLRSWGLSGVALNDANNVLVENVGVYLSGAAGFTGKVTTSASLSVLRSCISDGNGGEGFNLAVTSLENCLATNNTGIGFSISKGTLRGCVAINNSNGFFIANGSIDNCTAEDNLGFGFVVSAASISNSFALSNGGDGFSATHGSLSSCTAVSNEGDGFDLSLSSVAIGCLAQNNNNDGFRLGKQCALRNSVSDLNTNRGVSAIEYCTIENCSVTQNGISGIVAGSLASIRNNFVAQNSPLLGNSAGIVLQNDCFVDGNYIIENLTGVRANGADNIILRNIFNNNPTSIQLLGAGNQAPTSAIPATANAWLNISL